MTYPHVLDQVNVFSTHKIEKLWMLIKLIWRLGGGQKVLEQVNVFSTHMR